MDFRKNVKPERSGGSFLASRTVREYRYGIVLKKFGTAMAFEVGLAAVASWLLVWSLCMHQLLPILQRKTSLSPWCRCTVCFR